MLSSKLFAGVEVVKPELETLAPDEGYAVLWVEMYGALPESMRLSADEAFQSGYSMKGIVGGANLHIVKLEQGRYYWKEVRGNSRIRFRIYEDFFSLNVQSGTLNYGGHVSITLNPRNLTGGSTFVNRSSQIYQELNKCCADFLDKYPLVYSGQGTDPYLETFWRANKTAESSSKSPAAPEVEGNQHE
ncbi:hypothetical protein [Paraferrimonas sedimenticola]|uniref:hypothetical protein n=1 Tax=Paraferrimonas sedimenticola TaxID=375674 RepID=UPI001140FC29|nr:hypothetical protein [Paraferrimonas sedimenticola]